MEIMVLENGIKMIPITSELFHKVRMNYIADPMMSDHQYLYNKDSVQKEFEKKSNDKNRKWFVIMRDNEVIGDVYYKNLNFEKKTGVLSISLINNMYKEKGYGTAVEKEMIEYGITQLDLQIIYADTVLRNTRSQHVLEKVGFTFINEDSIFKYYRYVKK